MTDYESKNQLTSRGKFLQYDVFEAPSGTVAKLVHPADKEVKPGEIVFVDPKINTFSLGTRESAVFITLTNGKLFMGHTIDINLPLEQKVIIRQSIGVLVGGTRTPVDYVAGITDAGVITFYHPATAQDEETVFSLCFTEGSKIIFDWTIKRKIL